MKKLFITGTAGLVGSNISFFLKDKYDVYASDLNDKMKIDGCKMVPLDITNRVGLFDLFERIRPDYVIHLAALTDVAFCEKNKVLAKKVNVEGTKNIVDASKKINARLVYASSNYIFDGEKGNYSEEDVPIPINYYSLTKVLAEKEVLKYRSSVITRLCPYGIDIYQKNSFVSWILDNLRNNKKVDLFIDQYSSPMSTYDYALFLDKILRSDFTGIINSGGIERLSRYEFAKKLADAYHLDPSLLNKIRIEDKKEDAKRPKDTSLNMQKSRKVFGEIFQDTSSSLRRMKDLEDSGFISNFKIG